MVAESGLNKSTVFNIADTLRQLGFLEQDEDSRKYRLGHQFLRYGEIAHNSVEIVKVAEPFMIRLRDCVNETVQLAKLQKNETIYLHKVECVQSVKTFSIIGAANPAYATGLGKAMLAYQDAEYLQTHFPAVLPGFTPHTLPDLDSLNKELARIRQAGVAFDREEYSLGLACIACPIFDKKGNAVYAISISAPTYRLDGDKITNISQHLKNAAQQISHQLGYSAKQQEGYL
jgi:DNA-binding IclR family transcriptional regulator